MFLGEKRKETNLVLDWQTPETEEYREGVMGFVVAGGVCVRRKVGCRRGPDKLIALRQRGIPLSKAL